ncbi:MAG: iron-containing redox enzyme family protein [Gammaproteobacteria bacterium]|nr:iron-containing redox enzyme family protein [Gammaproteobacteria bacterium]
MRFYQRLVERTRADRAYLLAAPPLQRALAGNISLTEYVAFLTEAYHHVKHTVPLLMSVGGRLPASYEWLREAVAEYIEEEIGHQRWILNDIKACGGDAQAVSGGRPARATELMVAYAYDTVSRVNPLAFFGMVLVLEGTSVALASNAAEVLQRSLKLPTSAFSYLRSHGALDQDHIVHFENLMNRIDDPDDQHDIEHAAGMFYRLYADIFRSLDGPIETGAAQLPSTACAV